MSITNNKVYIVIRDVLDCGFFYGAFSSLEKAQNYLNTFHPDSYKYEFEIREEELDDPDI